MGTLEYDPALAEHQRHRDWLRERAIFKEVVPIASAAVRAKIHATYRLTYLKDIVLPRVIDDGTFASLTTTVMMNNMEVWSTIYFF